jgi:hypothetical protein
VWDRQKSIWLLRFLFFPELSEYIAENDCESEWTTYKMTAPLSLCHFPEVQTHLAEISGHLALRDHYFTLISRTIPTMSRASTSLLSSVSSATRQHITGSIRSASTRPPRAAASGPAVDYRIFQGVDGFLGEKEFTRLNEWQGGLWERLQAEVRSQCTHTRISEWSQRDRTDQCRQP